MIPSVRRRSCLRRRGRRLGEDVVAGGDQRMLGKMCGAWLLGMTLPAWHVLPLLLDIKIAADDLLPRLTEAALPITTTAMFVGWLLSSLALEPALASFTKEQLIVAHAVAMVLVVLATVALPGLTHFDLAILTLLRFAQGLLLNITALLITFPLDNAVDSWKNSIQVTGAIGYSCFTMLMSWICSGPLDWRSQAILFAGLPPLLVLTCFFPEWQQDLEAMAKTPLERAAVGGLTASALSEGRRNIIALGITFLACGSCFYGLSYSAGQLSEDPYSSTALLHGIDIAGYVVALSASRLGRKNLQAMCLRRPNARLSTPSTLEDSTKKRVMLQLKALGLIQIVASPPAWPTSGASLEAHCACCCAAVARRAHSSCWALPY